MRNSASKISQLILFLFINILFILKYGSRIDENYALGAAILYAGFICTLSYFLPRVTVKFSKRFFKIAVWILLSAMILCIYALLIGIDRYSVRVDRWSAVTFFIDGLLRGEYPYAIHTHLSETNFPSPFPVWYLINLPFYLLGDVGIGLVFFLVATVFCVYYYTESVKKTFIFLLLLCISPAYWWEVSVRSDSLSNVFLVFCFILLFTKKGYTLSGKYGLSVIVCGLLATTRLSAIIPLAMYFFHQFLHLSWPKKIIFPLLALSIVILAFSPFIFWDTNTWIFFSRNPFMSETSVGNIWILLLMLIIGIIMACRWREMSRFFEFTSLFTFLFILLSQIGLIYKFGIETGFFENKIYDISYFTLSLPWCLMAMLDCKNPVKPF